MKVAIYAGALALVLGGCGAMRSHDAEMSGTMDSAMGGQVDQALATLESNNKGDKDLLYFMEKGELLRLKGAYPDSRDSWLSADQFVRTWEDEAKNNPQKLLGDLGSVLINDKTRRYEGTDYEKVALAAKLALDHAVLGNWENARVEVRKMHEREAIIAEFRAKEVEALKKDAESKNITTTVQDLKGYPVETINAPEVTSLRNSYQSAFGHYLAGFIYETMGEPSLAAAGYRQAIELRPDVPMLKDGLSGLDGRVRAYAPGKTNTLFVIETGQVPALKSVTVPLPIPTSRGLNVVSTSFPTIAKVNYGPVPSSIQLGNGTAVQMASVTSFDAMARRSLSDAMPGIVIRTTIRGIAKGTATDAVQKSSVVGGLLMMGANYATESADERMWRSLPAQVALGRAVLSSGQHSVNVVTSRGVQKVNFEVQGPYSIVTLRLSDTGNVFLAQATTPGMPAPKLASPKSSGTKTATSGAKTKTTTASPTAAAASGGAVKPAAATR